MNKAFAVVLAVSMAIASFVGHAKTANAEDIDIIVDISDQVMYIETPIETFSFDVSTARKGYHTPRGVFKPYMLKTMHYSRKYDNAPMPNSVFFHGGYAIHATYDLKRLGRPASHGCIRLSPQNAKWLYHLISEYGKEATTIYIQD